MLIKKFEHQFVQTINKQFETDFLIVVGSFAKGTEHPNSDIDIVYYSNQSLSPSDYAKLTSDLEKVSAREVDLIDFKKVDDDFAIHVLTSGLPIYIKNENDFREFKKCSFDLHS